MGAFLTMTTQLKPCPYCGAETELRTSPGTCGVTFVVCLACGAVTSFCGKESETRAIQAYNQRAGERRIH